MRARLWLLVTLTLVAAAALAGAIALSASSSIAPREHTVESLFQDDQYLIYAPTATVRRTLATLASLGVERVRVTILWSAVAPAPRSRVRPPRFDAANPADYRAAAWAPYDRVLQLARARGIGVDFDLTAPGPLWAMQRRSPDPGAANHYVPSAREFARFVLAVGRRYSGSYVPLHGGRATGAPIPRVGFWSLWNEPNQPGWLAPQWGTVRGARVIESAALYRRYVDGAVGALYASGHRADTILIGELAPEGGALGPRYNWPVAPMQFLRALYCVDQRYRPLAGRGAKELGCPAAGGPSAFVASHPALFAVTGFSHHPYSFFLAPGAAMADPDFVPLSELSRLEHGLDGVFAAYGVRRRLPLYLTEYGYETDPPNPYRGVSPAAQAAYLAQAQYMAWLDPRVRALSQFLLYDSPPDRAYPRGSFRYWSTFQTGLLYASGARKPAFSSYRLPLFAPDPVFAAGRPLTIWGMLRPAPRDGARRARIEWRGAVGGYRTVATVTAGASSGVFEAQISPPGTGAVRAAWSSPGAVLYSRPVAVQLAG